METAGVAPALSLTAGTSCELTMEEERIHIGMEPSGP
jgi:hypothetical protein